jgi:hypothetical protein
MPCSQVVKLGFDKFMDEYSKRTNDYSTAGQNRGYTLYAQCKGADNDRRMKALTPARRDQLASVRRNLGKLEDASWGMQYLASGGGTMWSQMATAATATREEFLGSLITIMAQRQQPQPAARRTAMTLFNKARRKLDAFKKAPEHSSGPFSPAEQKKEHTQRWNEASVALQQLQKLLPALPDVVAQQLAQRVEGTISNLGEFE